MKTPRISIAPMVDYTDRHFMYFMSKITNYMTFYSEMISVKSIINGDVNKILKKADIKNKIVLQLATDNPEELQQAIKKAEPFGYDEYNLNIGCPSDRVQNANYGACLMSSPKLVRDLVFAAKSVTDKPVSVKHRIGIREFADRGFSLEKYEDMQNFVYTVLEAEPSRLIIHARIAILKGFSPKQNRNIPQIRYEDVYRLKDELLSKNINTPIEINGEIKTIDDIKMHLNRVDDVMIGREIYNNPYLGAIIDRDIFGRKDIPSRKQIIEEILDYADGLKEINKSHIMLMHIMGLFWNQIGSKKFKQTISPPYKKSYLPSELLKKAIENIDEDVLNART